MGKKIGGIVAIGGTVDFTLLDDPTQTTAALVKAAQEVSSTIHSIEFSDRSGCYAEELPKLASYLRDLFVSVEFVRSPTSKGKLPSGSDSFQVEVSSAYRTIAAFLTYDSEHLRVSDWAVLARTLANLEVQLNLFVEQYVES